jgi:sorbitol-specific phosphotransferase system component IIA
MKISRSRTLLATLLFALLLPTLSVAHDFEVDGIYYNIDGDNAIVTYKGNSYNEYSNEYTGNVNIPNSVSYNDNTYSVTSIGDYALQGCTGLTEVTIPNSVTSIGISAFSGCTGLTGVTIPSSVASIGNYAFGSTGLKTIYFNAENCNDFGFYDPPFYNCPINKIVIGDNVKKIPGCFAKWLSGLTDIAIPNSVTSVGYYAFSGCTGLTNITIPNSITTIYRSAFQDCTGLTNINIQNSIIGSFMFQGCTGLTEITIPSSVTSVGYYAFSGCTGLKTVYFNAENCSDFNYSDSPFSSCPIERIVIGDNVKEIPGYFAYRLTGLTDITIPNSVTSIGGSAFRGCTGLTAVTIPNSVTSIGFSAFSGCTGLTEITIPNSVTSIGESAFHGCTGLTEITIPNSVTSIGVSAFQGCTGLKTVYFNAENCDDFNYSYLPFSNCPIERIVIGDHVKKIPGYFAKGLTGLTEITIPNSVTTIYRSAFQGCTGLTQVTISNSVTSIGNNAFQGCTGLTQVTIPNSVTSIDGSAFNGCLRLTSVTIPSSVTSVGNYAFSGCTGLTSVNIQNSTIGGYMFQGCTGLTQVTIPNSVTSVGKYAFSGCTGLTNINIQNSIISTSMFQGCTGLTEITIPNSVTSIGGSAFQGCTGLKTVYFNAENCNDFNSSPFYNSLINRIIIGNNVKKIPGYFAKGLTSLTEITIPNSVSSIGQSAFQGCTGLTEITIPSSVTSFGIYAFSGCTGLTEITIPSSVTSVGYFTFSGCTGLTSINIQNSIIGSSMFEGCTGLTEITIPNSVTTIVEDAFKDCTGLKTVYFNAENCETLHYNPPFYNCPIERIVIGDNVKKIPSNFAKWLSGLTDITIPNSVTSIGASAFSGCSGLESVICWALEPPSLGSNAFYGVPNTMCVYVYPIAVDAYVNASGWNQFEILPMGDGHILSVSLPGSVNVQDYANMRLEVNNIENNQTLCFTLTDKPTYKFTVESNSTWNVTLTNLYGDLFGEIENVEVGEENVSVAFSSLLKPHDVSLIVKKPNGQDVTAPCKISWFNEDGVLLLQSNPIKKLPAGRRLKYQVSLPQDLATAFTLPSTNIYTVKDGNNDITCQLSAIGEAQLSGKVKDATNNQSLYGATISAVQSFGGGTTQTITARTDNQGQYLFDVSTVPTTLTIAATGYISQTIDCDMASGGSTVTVPDVALSPITGAVVNINLTYTPAHIEGEAAETQNWYSDYNNIDYGVYNKSKNHAISDIHVQYPQIVLMEDVNDGDVLELTATSRKNAFKPVKTTVTISEQKANATFNITELGKVTATFNRNINPKVTGSLYDADNKLLKAVDYSGSAQTIEELPDGNYTLVTMGKSDFFNSIYDLDEFADAGLTEGDDYVKNDMQVNSGIISLVSIDEVPFFDESKFYYTGEHTSFTVNKPDIVIGNYLTFRAQIDFKDQYANQVNDVQLIVDLPESCSFIDNSVMAGANMAVYSTSGNRITVPLQNWNDVVVRLCAIPTLPGDFAPNAFVRFKLKGKYITQPIGNANFHVESISSLIVPPICASTIISVGGTALSNCQIDIYGNDVLIGHTTSIANSKWLTKCELYKPYNLSRHNIYAIITTDQGIQVPTETATCIYDKSEPQVSKVTQYNEQRGPTPYIVIWDFLNPSLSTQHYSYDMYDNHRTFTYTIEFTDNQAVDNVMLYVKTAKGHWWPLEAAYDSAKDVWVTAGEFGDSQNADLPVNVAVGCSYLTKQEIDREQIDDQYNYLENQLQFEEKQIVENYISSINQALLSNDTILIDNSIQMLYDYLNIDLNGFDDGGMSIEDVMNIPESEFEIAEFLDPVEHISISDETGNEVHALSKLSLSELNNLYDLDLFEEFSSSISDSTSIKFYIKDNTIIFVDSCRNLCYVLTNRVKPTRINAINLSDLDEFLTHWSQFQNIVTFTRQELTTWIEELVAFFNKSMQSLNVVRESKNRIKRGIEVPYTYKECCEKEKKLLKETSGIRRCLKLLRGLFKTLDFAAILNDINKATNSIVEWKGIIRTIETIDCPGMNELAEKAKNYSLRVARGYNANISVNEAAFLGVQNLCKRLGPAKIGAAWAVAFEFLLADISIILDGTTEIMDLLWKTEIQNKIPFTNDCDDEDPITGGSPTGGAAPISEPNGHKYPGADMNFCIDPSGFVYEGVPSNRLQGVTATCYYKETVEDMYGDSIENVVLWDAENYGQENPLITDVNGYYRWDVPIGMWQVKYEKEGYETTYSDWLPVPPPQLDVNIGMVQMCQPEVIKARAYPKAVEFEFNKFMFPETLNSNNITVTVNGSPVSGTIELLNAEVDDPLAITSIRRAPGTGLTFASKVRFNASSPFNADKVTLHVKKDVKSYADLEMYEDYEAVLDVELEIQSIEADSTVNILYGDSRELTVTVLPANASRGNTLSVRSVAPMLATTDAESYTLNNNGQAFITVHGDLPGMTSLLYSIDGYDLNAATLVNVLMENQMTVATPTASIASGSEVEKGMAVYLNCSTPGATIYYTLDGSCPCDNTTARKVYDGNPIIINRTVTIKAMATAPDLYDSDVATFVYRVAGGKKGDVNGDGEVNIADVNAVIDIILGGQADADTRYRADVNGDGEVNIADINAVIDIILNPATHMMLKVNCDDLLHMDDVTMKPGDVRTLHVTVDHAAHYSALQCDIVLPAGLTLMDVYAPGANSVRTGGVNDNTYRALNYSMARLPFVGDTQPVMTFSVRADAALDPESEISLTNVVLADAGNKAWRVSDCTARVNNASGINDMTAAVDRVWVEGRTLFIEARQDGTAQLAMINGMVSNIPLKAGINRQRLDRGIYIVVINGQSHKIAIK